MMNIRLNGKDHEIDTDTTVSILLKALEVQTAGTAVAINGDIISRDTFDTHAIRDDDSVDILRAIGGG